MKKSVYELSQNPKAAFNDWEVIESSYSGIEVDTVCEDSFINLPNELLVAADKLKDYVPNEDENLSSPYFNGGRYCLVRYDNFLKGLDEKNKCVLYFKKSDYRSFLVTNGLNDYWADIAGLKGRSRLQWSEYWKSRSIDLNSFFLILSEYIY